MSLKISFESDLKGFERVQSALKEQEKILNSNADAVERLKKAQAGMGTQAADMGKNHSMKEAAKQMETLTGAFDALQKNQSGFRAFLNNFTDFKKELQDISNIKSDDVFGAIETRIDTLKKSLAGSVEASKSLRSEVAQLKAEGRNDEASKAQARLSAVEQQSLEERSLLQDAQLKKLYRQPIFQSGGQGGMPPGGGGGMGGFLGGGTSMQRLVGLLGRGMAGLGVAKMVGDRASRAYQRYGFMEERGEIAAFEQEMGIQQSAESGQIGRALMRRHNLGKEGNYRRRRAEGKFGGESALDSLDMAYRRVTGFFSGKSPEQLEIEFENEKSQLDQRYQRSINTVASTAKGILTNQSYMGFESVLGKQGAQELIRQVNRGGASWAEAQATLGTADKYGLAGQFAGSRLTRTTSELGLSRGAIDQIVRQSAYSGVDQDKLMGQIMTRAGQSGMPLTTATRQALSQVVAQQAGQFAGGVDMAQVSAPMLNAMANMQSAGVNLQGVDMIAGAQAVSSFAQGRAQQAGTMEGMGLEKSLIDLGIKNPVARRAIIDMYTTEGKQQGAIKVAAKLSGKSIEEVSKALNASQTMAKEFRKKVMGGEEFDHLQQVFKDEGDLDLQGYGMTGDVKSALAVPGMSKAYGAHDMGATASIDGLQPSFTQTTTGRQVKASEARKESESLKLTEGLAEQLAGKGGDVGKELVKMFTGYTDQMLMEVQQGIQDLITRQAETLEDEKAEERRQQRQGFLGGELPPFKGTKNEGSR